MNKILLLLFACAASPASGQKMEYKGFPSLVWPKLYNISFVKASDDLGEFDKPVFTPEVRALAGKSVILPGYMVRLENGMTSENVMLSSLPLNACFFCGVGGPETVVEVHLTEKTDYIEKPIQVKGTLRLNDNNPDRMIYILENAVILGPPGF